MENGSTVILGKKDKIRFEKYGAKRIQWKKTTHKPPSWIIRIKQNIQSHHYYNVSLCMIVQ